MNKRIVISLPEKLVDKIRERAKNEYRSVSKQVKLMIEKGGVKSDKSEQTKWAQP